MEDNKNIIMAAEQTIPISTRKVIVIHTRTIPQGISAMLAFDPETGDEDNAIEMQKSTERIATGQVTFAARDSDYDGKQISFVENDVDKSVMKLLKQMVKRESQFITVIYGEDVDESSAALLEEQIRQKYGAKTEITVINGGQPIYYYILSVE